MIDKEVQNVLENKYTNCVVKKQKLLEVLFLSQELLEQFNLKDCQLLFLVHSHAKGMCHNDGERISLQINYCINQDIEEIRNTILHEIAHALVGNDDGHNLVWKKKALELGVKL